MDALDWATVARYMGRTLNPVVAHILKTPGRHTITTPGMNARKEYTVVETDENGTIYQLTPAGERDGVLSLEGFHPDTTIVILHGDDA